VAHSYSNYQDIDKEALQHDIDAVKETLGAPTWEDFQHLLKLEKWGRSLTFIGYALMVIITFLEITEAGISTIAFWSGAVASVITIGAGNVSRWANVAHPILHGAYDKVPGVPKRYTKSGFAKGKRRYIDWLDWITPDSWSFEHNIMHHYHLGELDDPDNVERNMRYLTSRNLPYWVKYIFVYLMAATWKFTYYAPNTLRILENQKRKRKRQPEFLKLSYSPFSPNGKELWSNYYAPYFLIKFVAIPALFIPLGGSAVLTAFLITFFAEAVANLHSFLVIVPNHSAEDIYQFEEPHKSQGEFYLRQIMGSVNYNTGNDLIDFSQGWLNYQIEHHLFPNLPLSQYQKMQPIVKEICKKHNLEYRQESVFKRILMTVDLMVGKTKLLKIDTI
jgi:fatty acid desaturase